MLGGKNIKIKILLLLFIGTSLFACSDNKNKPDFKNVALKDKSDLQPETIQDTTDYKIAYNVGYDLESGNYEIFVMNGDGSEQRNISNHPGVDWVYYAHKDRLYFVSDRDTISRKYFLYEMKWDGTEIRRITDFLVHDSWISSRKNGSEFVVTINKKDDSDTRDLFIINKEGDILFQLTNDNFQNTDPHFSPDGSKIVFRSNRSEFDELYIINDDGTDLKQLTEYPNSDDTALEWEYHAGPPQWIKPDQITYISKQNRNYSIFSISPNTNKAEQLTPDSSSTGYYSNEGWHSWSRDGSHVAFNATNRVGNYDIYIMSSEVSNLRRLTDNAWIEQAPVFVYPED